MSDEPVLHDEVAPAIYSAKLPTCPLKRMWGGPGSGNCCAICEQPVKPDELEYELQFPQERDGRAGGNCHVHIGCFLAWQSLRQTPELSPGD